MAKFEVTSPDGKSFEVTAPEGATQDQALAYAKQQFGGQGGDVPRGTQAPAVPAFEKEARELIESTPAERISANPIFRTLTRAAEPVIGASSLIEKLWGGTANADNIRQLHEMQEKGAKALGYSPASSISSDVAGDILSPLGIGGGKLAPAVTAVGRMAQGAATGGLAGVLTPNTESPTTEGAKGAAAGGVLTGLLEGLTKIPGLPAAVKAITERIGGKAPEATKPADTSAEKVLSEAQRQRNVMEGHTEPTGASEYERSAKDFEERMKASREAAFNAGGKVDASDTLKMIEQMEAKNPDAQVRAALREAKNTINRAATSARSAALPAAGAKVTPQQLRAFQGDGATFDTSMADEVRQSINRQINQRGDKALGPRTQDLLSQVRDSIVGKTPKEYQEYLRQYAKGRADLDKYHANDTLKKLTSGDQSFQQLTGRDAQNVLDHVFKGDTPGKGLDELISITAHDKQASDALRKSFGNWLTRTDSATNEVGVKPLLSRWEQSRDAVEKSGLFTQAHVSNINAVMDDMRSQYVSRGAKQAANTVGGFLVGIGVGHPFMGSHFAREVSTEASAAPAKQAIQDAIAQLSMTSGGAAALAAKPTPSNLRKIEQMIPVLTGKGDEQEAPRRRHPITGMTAGASL